MGKSFGFFGHIGDNIGIRRTVNVLVGKKGSKITFSLSFFMKKQEVSLFLMFSEKIAFYTISKVVRGPDVAQKRYILYIKKIHYISKYQSFTQKFKNELACSVIIFFIVTEYGY